MTDQQIETTYQAQLSNKQNFLTALLAEFNAPPIAIFESPREYYRMRAEFRIWHDGDDLFYAMFAPGDKTNPIRVENSTMVSEPINQLMKPLVEYVRDEPELSRKLFQIDFLSTSAGEVLVSMLYHRPIGDEWETCALRLQADLGISIIGRSRKKKIVLEKDYVIESMPLPDKTYFYQQVENSFTQPNAKVAVDMVRWARDAIGKHDDDLLELYCGNGNFSIALSGLFRKVLATEVSKSSVKSAQFNIAKNKIENLKVIRLSSEEFTQAMNNEREFRRLKESDVVLSDYQFSTVLVDPPRAGLDMDTLKMISAFDNILYISCNPQTLQTNLKTLVQTHSVQRAALFDQFPYTEHIESGVWLQKK